MIRKILFVTSTLERSGPTNVIYNIVKYLDRTKFDPAILTLSPEPTNSRLQDFLALSIPFHTLQKSRLYWMLSSLKELKVKIDKINPDIIHSHTYRADVSVARHLKKYKLISTLHSDLFANYKDTYGALVARFFEYKQISAVSTMNMVVACSVSAGKKYQDQIPTMRVIQNGIDTSLFLPGKKPESRSKLNLPFDTRIFISAGLLIKRKDPETVIKGFLSGAEKNDILIVLGSGDLYENLKQKYHSEKRIYLKGLVTDVEVYMQAADFFISASHSEGLPNTVMEALGSGLPVVLSNIPAHQEILDINPKAGLLFQPGSSEDLACKIRELIKNKTEASEASLQIVQSRLNSQFMTRQYEIAYTTLQ